MLGNIYSNYNERVKVIGKTKRGYKCKRWLNGQTNESDLTKNQLNQMQYICTIQ